MRGKGACINLPDTLEKNAPMEQAVSGFVHREEFAL